MATRYDRADPAIVGRGVTVSYGDRVALDAGDFTLAAGSVTALIGPNGSGKSTLLSAIAGLVPLAAGELTVLGSRPGARRLVTRLAYVLQATAANDTLPVTVREVVTMARFAARGAFGRLTADDRRVVAESMDRLEVASLADRHLRELSGGQRQRVLVAQGLAQEADVLLLDEPLTGLDMASAQQIFAVIGDLRRRGGTVLVSTHDLGDAERCDEVLLLARRVIAQGPPAAVLTLEHLRAAYGERLHRDAHERAPFEVDPHAHPHAPGAWGSHVHLEADPAGSGRRPSD